MALGANLHAQFLFGGTGLECFATNTGYFGVLIFRVYVFFHRVHLFSVITKGTHFHNYSTRETDPQE